MLNSVKARAKRSKIEKMMNQCIITIFIVQIILCIFSALYYNAWYQQNRDDIPYLEIDQNGTTENSASYILLVRYGNWMLIFTNFVPISLMMSLEMVRFLQAGLISLDKEMTTGDLRTIIQSSNLNEEIGQIQYIFSDKTGTLTKNLMEFKKISIGGISYGENKDMSPADLKALPAVENVDFEDSQFFTDMKNSQNSTKIMKTLQHIALCHTIICEEKNGVRNYNASSPDELALVNWAKFSGCEYLGINENNEMTIKVKDQVESFLLLNVLEFTSARKRMSIIVKSLSSSQVILLCKGADSIILERMNTESPDIAETNKNLEVYANIGLRTLLLAERVIPEEEYKAWAKRYNEASTAIKNREKLVEDLQEEIEKDMELVGATAIEDKLQDEVGETIATLKETGIKVWVLTGDKIETAINIALSCKLFDTTLEKIIIDGKTQEDVKESMRKADIMHQVCIEEHKKFALVVSGVALIYLMRDDVLSRQLVEIGDLSNAVVACRVSPKQKQEVVSLVRKHKPDVTTLAIGDGANDVNMIIAAHVGIGIKGVEGHQASRASDYAFGEFRHLRRLLLCHGRESYRKNTKLILYNFFKNMILVLPQFWWAFNNALSGISLYDSFVLQFFNLFYTSLPIIVFALFDKEYDDRVLVKNPRLYIQGMKGKLFSKTLFWVWVIWGAVQACAIAYLCVFAINMNFVTSEGFTQDIYMLGLVIFSFDVPVSNFKVLLFSNTHSVLSLGINAISNLFYIINIPVFSAISSIAYYKFVSEFFSIPGLYIGLVVVIGATTIIDRGVTGLIEFTNVQVEKKNFQLLSETSTELKSLRKG